MTKLDDNAYQMTFGNRQMVRVDIGEEPPFDFWPYVEKIPHEDYEGFDCSEGQVDWVWRSEDGKFEHVLIETADDKNVFMVIVLNIRENSVVGHRIIDLANEYGVR